MRLKKVLEFSLLKFGFVFIWRGKKIKKSKLINVNRKLEDLGDSSNRLNIKLYI